MVPARTLRRPARRPEGLDYFPGGDPGMPPADGSILAHPTAASRHCSGRERFPGSLFQAEFQEEDIVPAFRRDTQGSMRRDGIERAGEIDMGRGVHPDAVTRRVPLNMPAKKAPPLRRAPRRSRALRCAPPRASSNSLLHRIRRQRRKARGSIPAAGTSPRSPCLRYRSPRGAGGPSHPRRACVPEHCRCRRNGAATATLRPRRSIRERDCRDPRPPGVIRRFGRDRAASP